MALNSWDSVNDMIADWFYFECCPAIRGKSGYLKALLLLQKHDSFKILVKILLTNMGILVLQAFGNVVVLLYIPFLINLIWYVAKSILLYTNI